jgi:hypothetical protein
VRANKDGDWVRVRYRDVFGWADELSLRDIHGIVVRPTPIRREIFVRWDSNYPAGYINVRNVIRV